MRKMIIISLVGASLFLSGCGANNGLSIGGLGQTEVKKVFQSGVIITSQKVLVSKDMIATVTGAGVGAVAGAILGSRTSSNNALKGGIIGAGVGAVGGYLGGMMLDNNEKEAYQISIKDKNGALHTAYLENQLPLNTELEFIVRDDGKITNIDVKK